MERMASTFVSLVVRYVCIASQDRVGRERGTSTVYMARKMTQECYKEEGAEFLRLM